MLADEPSDTKRAKTSHSMTEDLSKSNQLPKTLEEAGSDSHELSKEVQEEHLESDVITKTSQPNYSNRADENQEEETGYRSVVAYCYDETGQLPPSDPKTVLY